MFQFAPAVSEEQVLLQPAGAEQGRAEQSSRTSYLQAEVLDSVETVRGRHPDCGRTSRGLRSRFITREGAETSRTLSVQSLCGL